MTPSQERFGIALALPLRDAVAILKQIAEAVWAVLPAGGEIATEELLLDLVPRLAAGVKSALESVVGLLPYDGTQAERYVQLACLCWLEQASIASAKGSSLSESLSAEFDAARFATEPPIVVNELAEPRPIVMNEPEAEPQRRVMNDPETEPQRRVMNDPEAEPRRRPLGPLANEYRVWFGTNRAFTRDNPKTPFSGERSRTVTYGYCDVYVPLSHKIGSLGSSFIQRLVSRTDDRLKLTRTCPVPDESFWLLIKSQLGLLPPDRRHAVVFAHGYNMSFEKAALRTAQIGFDLGIAGAMAFFSWPSKGNVQDYQADEASIEASEPALTDFLVDFATKSEASAVHVIAHSMGNRGVLRAVRNIAQSAQQRAGVPFANFILAAPDIDADTFVNFAEAYGRVAQRTTLYVSERDRAVALSQWLHEYPRAGFAPPLTVCPGIDTVNVTDVDLTVLGHGYVAAARGVLSDMHALIFENAAPDARFGLQGRMTDSGERYWVVGA